MDKNKSQIALKVVAWTVLFFACAFAVLWLVTTVWIIVAAINPDVNNRVFFVDRLRGADTNPVLFCFVMLVVALVGLFTGFMLLRSTKLNVPLKEDETFCCWKMSEFALWTARILGIMLFWYVFFSLEIIF